MAIGNGAGAVQDQPAAQKARILRVRVVDDSKDSHPAVNLKVPMGVVRWGMRIGQAFSPQLKDADLDWDRIAALLEQDELGKIVEVEDEAEHRRVEVWVE